MQTCNVKKAEWKQKIDIFYKDEKVEYIQKKKFLKN